MERPLSLGRRTAHAEGGTLAGLGVVGRSGIGGAEALARQLGDVGPRGVGASRRSPLGRAIELSRIVVSGGINLTLRLLWWVLLLVRGDGSRLTR